MKNGVLFVLLSTLGLSLKGIWARLAYAEGMDVSSVIFYRSALAAPLLLGGGLWLLKRNTSASENSQVQAKVSARDLVPAVLLGLLFSIGMTCDFQSIAALGASVSRVILFGFPLLVLAFEAIATRRMPKPPQLVGFFVAWLGLAAVASGGFFFSTGSPGGMPPAGLLWGVFSLILYALYTWLSGRLSQRIGSVRVTMVSQLTTTLVVVFFLLIQGGGEMPSLPKAGLLWIVLMVFVSTVIPYFLMMEGIARLGSSEASLLAMGGPILTVLAGYLVLGEQLSWGQLLGTAAVIFGVSVAQTSFRPAQVPAMARESR